MSGNSKLKPCPFCGNNGIGIAEIVTTKNRIVVHCEMGCGGRTPYCDSEEEAVKKWNTRVGSCEEVPTERNSATSSDAPNRDMPLFTRKCDERIKELEKGYAEAIQDIEDWAAYAGEYFQDRHDLVGCLADHKAALEGSDSE
jgi:Lar family restriction alleviation protein